MAGKRGKTIRQLLEVSGLPEEYQTLVLNNWKGAIMKRHKHTLTHLLLLESKTESFLWRETDQTKKDKNFWPNVYSYLHDPKQFQLPPIPES
jgi:hypothetical protein